MLTLREGKVENVVHEQHRGVREVHYHAEALHLNHNVPSKGGKAALAFAA